MMLEDDEYKDVVNRFCRIFGKDDIRVLLGEGMYKPENRREKYCLRSGCKCIDVMVTYITWFNYGKRHNGLCYEEIVEICDFLEKDVFGVVFGSVEDKVEYLRLVFECVNHVEGWLRDLEKDIVSKESLDVFLTEEDYGGFFEDIFRKREKEGVLSKLEMDLTLRFGDFAYLRDCGVLDMCMGILKTYYCIFERNVYGRNENMFNFILCGHMLKWLSRSISCK